MLFDILVTVDCFCKPLSAWLLVEWPSVSNLLAMFCARDEFVDGKMSSVGYVNGDCFWQRYFVKLPHHFPGFSQSRIWPVPAGLPVAVGELKPSHSVGWQNTLFHRKVCVLSQPNIFIVALLIFAIIFQVYVQFHFEIILSLGWGYRGVI